MISSFQKNKQKRIKEMRKRFHFDPQTQMNKSNIALKQKVSQIVIKDQNGQFSSVKQNNQFNDSSWLARLVNGIQQSDNPCLKPVVDLDHLYTVSSDKVNDKNIQQGQEFTIIRKSTQPAQRQMGRKSVPSAPSVSNFRNNKKLSKDSKQNSRMSCIVKMSQNTNQQKQQKIVKPKYQKWTSDNTSNANVLNSVGQSKKFHKPSKNTQKGMTTTSNSNSNLNMNLFKYKNKSKQRSGHAHKNSLINYSSIMEEQKNFDLNNKQQLIHLQSPQKIQIDLDQISLKTEASKQATPVHRKALTLQKQKVKEKKEQAQILKQERNKLNISNIVNNQLSINKKRTFQNEKEKKKQKYIIIQEYNHNQMIPNQSFKQQQKQPQLTQKQLNKSEQKSKVKNKNKNIGHQTQNTNNIPKNSSNYNSTQNYTTNKNVPSNKKEQMPISINYRHSASNDKAVGKNKNKSMSSSTQITYSSHINSSTHVQQKQKQQLQQKNREKQIQQKNEYKRKACLKPTDGIIPHYNTPELQKEPQSRSSKAALSPSKNNSNKKYKYQDYLGLQVQEQEQKDRHLSSHNQFLDTFKQQSIPYNQMLNLFDYESLIKQQNLIKCNFQKQNKCKQQVIIEPKIGKIKKNNTQSNNSQNHFHSQNQKNNCNQNKQQAIKTQDQVIRTCSLQNPRIKRRSNGVESISKIEVKEIQFSGNQEMRIPTFSQRPLEQQQQNNRQKQNISNSQGGNLHSPIKYGNAIKKQHIQQKVKTQNSSSKSNINLNNLVSLSLSVPVPVSVSNNGNYGCPYNTSNNSNNISNANSNINSNYHSNSNSHIYSNNFVNSGNIPNTNSNHISEKTSINQGYHMGRNKQQKYEPRTKPSTTTVAYTELGQQLPMQSPKFNYKYMQADTQYQQSCNNSRIHSKVYEELFVKLDHKQLNQISKNNCNQAALTEEERYEIGSILSKIKYLDRVLNVKEFVHQCYRIAGRTQKFQDSATPTISNSNSNKNIRKCSKNLSSQNLNKDYSINLNNYQTFQPTQKSQYKVYKHIEQRKQPSPVQKKSTNNATITNSLHMNIVKNNGSSIKSTDKKREQKYYIRSNQNIFKGNIINHSNTSCLNSNDKAGRLKRPRKYSEKSEVNYVNNTYTERVIQPCIEDNISNSDATSGCITNYKNSHKYSYNYAGSRSQTKNNISIGNRPTNSNWIANDKIKEISSTIYRPLFPETQQSMGSFNGTMNLNRDAYLQLPSFPNQNVNAINDQSNVCHHSKQNSNVNNSNQLVCGKENRQSKGDIGTIIDSLNNKLSNYIQTNNLEDTYRKFKLQFVQLRRNMQY